MASSHGAVWRFLMADESVIPDRFIPALRWVLVVIVLLVIGFGISDSFREGKTATGWLYVAIFIVVFAIAVKWHAISEAFVRWRQKMAWILVALGFGGALALGIAIGGLLLRGGPLGTIPQSGGRITWSFDQPGDNYFLNIGRLGDQELRVVGFQAHGKNTSTDPISEFSGFIRSDLTNVQRQVYLLAQDPNNVNRPPLGPQMMLPTLPDETYGIPGLADFDISTHDKPFTEIGKDGEPLSEFLRKFGAFTLILKYDGATIERHFTIEQIKAQAALLEKQTSPLSTTAPRVTRKPTAAPVPTFPFMVPSPPTAPPPTDTQPPPKG